MAKENHAPGALTFKQTSLSSNAVGAAASFLQRQLNTFSHEGVWVVLEAVSRVNCTYVHLEHHSRTVTSSSNTVCGSMISHCRTLKRGEPPAARRLSTSGIPLYAAFYLFAFMSVAPAAENLWYFFCHGCQIAICFMLYVTLSAVYKSSSLIISLTSSRKGSIVRSV